MFYPRRCFSAVLTGLLCGFFCFLGGKYIFDLPLGWSNLGFILINRAMIGFVIGISALIMHWSLHGALVGTVVGSIFVYADAMFGFSWFVVVSAFFVNPVFGVFIEFVTSVLANAPVRPKSLAR